MRLLTCNAFRHSIHRLELAEYPGQLATLVGQLFTPCMIRVTDALLLIAAIAQVWVVWSQLGILGSAVAE